MECVLRAHRTTSIEYIMSNVIDLLFSVEKKIELYCIIIDICIWYINWILILFEYGWVIVTSLDIIGIQINLLLNEKRRNKWNNENKKKKSQKKLETN